MLAPAADLYYNEYTTQNLNSITLIARGVLFYFGKNADFYFHISCVRVIRFCVVANRVRIFRVCRLRFVHTFIFLSKKRRLLLSPHKQTQKSPFMRAFLCFMRQTPVFFVAKNIFV